MIRLRPIRPLPYQFNQVRRPKRHGEAGNAANSLANAPDSEMHQEPSGQQCIPRSSDGQYGKYSRNGTKSHQSRGFDVWSVSPPATEPLAGALTLSSRAFIAFAGQGLFTELKDPRLVVTMG
jgi:hypothetical protein